MTTSNLLYQQPLASCVPHGTTNGDAYGRLDLFANHFAHVSSKHSPTSGNVENGSGSHNMEKELTADNLSLTDDEEEYANSVYSSALCGTLNKWTNYLHGWQSRYFVLKDGTLSYFKSELDMSIGCRGAISLSKAVIQTHEFDECRFDVSVNDCVWYLRADSEHEKLRWVDAVEVYKADSGFGSLGDLRRHGSMLSLTSNKSLASSSSFKNGRGLREKLAEMETFRDILCRQVDSLQLYFDHCSGDAHTSGMHNHDDTLEADEFDDDTLDECSDVNSVSSSQTLPFKDSRERASNELFPHHHNNHAHCSSSINTMDFRGEALTFKATTAGVLTTLQHCIELMQQREETWKRRLEREIDRKKKMEESYRHALQERSRQRPVVVLGGPDFEEGPHSALNEDEWHDAVDAALERQDQEDRRVMRILSTDSEKSPVRPYKGLTLPKDHSLFSKIDATTQEQLHYALAGVEEGVWQLFAEDGEMKMYKREVEIDGLVCDPLKAVHSVQGVTAHEYCHFFFEPDYKMDWDTSLENVRVLDRISADTIVFHQVHKRVWPASQRESLFWSHLRHVVPNNVSGIENMWIVCNNDTMHDMAPLNDKCVRVGLRVAMVCQTVVNHPPKGEPLTREHIVCNIVYVAQVNPGGWAPSSILRTVYKREFPKFLKRFTQYVLQKIHDKPIQM